jgi:hypothetical protein
VQSACLTRNAPPSIELGALAGASGPHEGGDGLVTYITLAASPANSCPLNPVQDGPKVSGKSASELLGVPRGAGPVGGASIAPLAHPLFRADHGQRERADQVELVSGQEAKRGRVEENVHER